MRFAPLAVLGSFIVSAAVVGVSLWSVPAVRLEFQGYSGNQWAGAVVMASPLIAACTWPWLLAFARAYDHNMQRSSLVFSAAALVPLGLIYSPSSGAPAEGIGFSLLLYVVLIWLAFPLSMAIGRLGE